MMTKIIAILLLLLVQPTFSNLIISVTPSTNQVGQSAIISVFIRASINFSDLDFTISNAFDVVSPVCTLGGVPVSCSKITPGSGSTVGIRYSGLGLLANSNYTLTFSATNPLYADNFVLQGTAGSTAFINTGTIQIDPKQIACSMSSQSPVVGRSSRTTFTLDLKTLPSATIGSIAVSVAVQTSFSNVINPSPTCQMNTTQYSCSLTQIFGQQILTVLNTPVGMQASEVARTLSINTLRNPPFNSTFVIETLTIQIKDSLGRDVEECSVIQPAPSQLAESTYFTLQGWGNTVGKTSDINLHLTPSLTILQNPLILLVYPKDLSITPKAPALYTSTIQGDYTYLYINNASLTDSILSFTSTSINPTSVIPLSLHSYLMYNQTHFRQHKSLLANTLTLTTQTVNTSISLLDSNTLTPTTANITLLSPIKVSQGLRLTMLIDHGQINCNILLLGSSITPLQLQTCNSSQLVLNTTQSIIKNSQYWITFRYITHISLQPNSLHLSVSSLTNNSIMEGLAAISTQISSQSFTIVSINSTFTAISDYTFTQSNSTVLTPISLFTRVFTIQLPLYATVTAQTTVTVADDANSSTSILSWEVDQSTNIIVVTVSGRLAVKIGKISNPSHYQGGRQWTISAKDTNGYDSSNSNSTHTPNYSPAQSKISILLSNQTIQEPANTTLNFQPLLQYNLTSPPTITVTFSTGSSIRNISTAQCPNCTLLTSTKFSFPYYGVVMSVMLEVVNNENPVGNVVSFVISLGGFTYEIGSIGYELDPLLYAYTASFTGLYAELGTVQITITSTLGREVNLTYTGSEQIFSSDQQCRNCNSTYLKIEGIVNFFQTEDIIVSGIANGVLYARAIIPIYYSCYDIPGCQICLTRNNSLVCDRCFPNNFTLNYLLYQQQCYSVCPASTYPNGVVCQSCPQLCYRCNQLQCLECITPYSIYQSTCVLDCPPAYIKNATHCLPRPVICPQNCIDCPEDNVCQQCNGGYLLLDNLCYSECPEGYIESMEEPICIQFVPPEQTDYFPFAFFLVSTIGLILLVVIKKFQRRSLVIGNYIAIAAFLEIGAMIMMISYTFISMRDEPERWPDNQILLTQALLFILLVTKVILNLIFLAYFLRVISNDQNFQKWLDKNSHHYTLYIVLLVLSAVFSFQIMRIIYSRLLGLQLFYGRFNTSLIFKPLNFFSLAYLIPGGCLIIMAANNIHMQDGYRTSIFYSSIQVILMEVCIAIGCILEACRSDKEYFEYQVYKVENEHDQSSASKVNIMFQEEHGGNSQKLLSGGTYVGSSSSVTKPSKIGRIRKNMKEDPLWKERPYSSSISQKEEEVQVEQEDQQGENEKDDDEIVVDLQAKSEDLPLGLESNSKSPSIFRQKILKDWEKLRQSLPKGNHAMHRRSSTRIIPISKSPSPKRKASSKKQNENNEKDQRKLSTSLTKIQVRTPVVDFKNKHQLKRHFYRINEQQEDEDQLHASPGKQHQNIDEDQKGNNNRSPVNSDLNTFDDAKNGEIDRQIQLIGNTGQGNRKEGENISEIRDIVSQESFEKSLLELGQNMKINRYDDYEDDPNDIVERRAVSPKNKVKMSAGQPESYRKLKKYKGKHVNKQTEAVYLQRLGSSEAPKRVPRSRRLDDF